ncbi:unnamed protein product [Hydatigera taeniaeformis]|uniref:Homoserine_dh domain-containing protein n=1 Tax=Hydatigena taeniaeformis TaxID=6205 RepID=A0A0R3WQG3_HYDTA|nr:unnamed protein product [Hydatigera taeniaeformis]
MRISSIMPSPLGAKVSVIAGHLSSEFAESNGLVTNLQLGDRAFDMNYDADSTTSVISFQTVENEVGAVTQISLADLRATVVKLASLLRERLMPLLHHRGVDLASEEDQSKTFLATYITTGVNRVFLQVTLPHF